MAPTPDTGDRRPLKVVFVAAHDSLGGAARAAYRVFDAISTYFPDRIDISFRVIHKTRDDERIVGGKASRNRIEYAQYFLRTRFRKYFPRKPFISANTLLHSQALYPTGLGREINKMSPDVILLGWLGNATISIAEIGQLRAPVVWRLSDMWMFSGAEHYTDTGRYRVGYSKRSRPPDEWGPDIDRETFRRKCRHWKKPPHVIALTRWLQKEAQSSALSGRWPTHVIPVPMDTDFWAPTDAKKARDTFGIEQNAVVVMFGAGNGTSQPHKGADLLFGALAHLKDFHAAAADTRPLRAIVFGEDRPTREEGGVPVQFLGRLDDEGLRKAYSAADVFVVPSRLEAFGQVAAEAQCCGTPVVAFDNSGLADVVEDRVTGALARAFDPRSLADAIYWVIENPQRTSTIGAAATARARTLWDPETVAHSYVAVLEQAASQNG